MIAAIETSVISYHGQGWAGALARSCAGARRSIYLSALSLHPPTPNAQGEWPELWRAWCAAVQRGVTVDMWLPAPSPVHPATARNSTAGRTASEAGITMHYVTGVKLLHAKSAVIDAAEIWIGSGNFTAAAAHHNHEAYLQAICPRIAHELISRWKSLA